MHFKWSHSIFEDVIWCDDGGVKTFLCEAEDLFLFALKRWDHSSNGELLLCFGMFYSEMTSCYRKTLLPSTLKVMSSRNQPEIKVCVVVFKKHTHAQTHTILFQMLYNNFFYFCVSAAFLQTSVNHKPYRTYCIHPLTYCTDTRTYTHTHTVELPTWIDLNTHAYLPLWNSSLCSLKAPKLLPASSPPVCTPSPSILPSSHPSFGSYLMYRPPLLLIPLLFEVLARTSLLGIENIEITDCSPRCISIEVKEDRWLMISP